jgi:hypothetical protein
MYKQVGCKREKKWHPYWTKKFGKVRKKIKGWNVNVGNDKIVLKYIKKHGE